MADIHALDGNNKQWRLVMHFPVPGGVNSVGVSWSDALVLLSTINTGLPPQSILNNSTTGDPATAGPGEISDNAKAALAAGTLFEHQKMVPLESNGTLPAQLRVAARKFYRNEKADLTDQLKQKLKYFGYQEAGA
jgi:hypothetical protein